MMTTDGSTAFTRAGTSSVPDAYDSGVATGVRTVEDPPSASDEPAYPAAPPASTAATTVPAANLDTPRRRAGGVTRCCGSCGASATVWVLAVGGDHTGPAGQGEAGWPTGPGGLCGGFF